MPEDKIDANMPESIPSQEGIKNSPGQKFEKPEKREQFEQSRNEVLKEITDTPQTTVPSSGIVDDTNQQSKRKEREKKIEAIMEEGLKELYIKLPPNLQVDFRVNGERAANEINEMLDKAKVKVKKIISIIKNWLVVIPGVNKFFLEQTAKIKTDEIMKLKNHE